MSDLFHNGTSLSSPWVPRGFPGFGGVGDRPWSLNYRLGRALRSIEGIMGLRGGELDLLTP